MDELAKRFADLAEKYGPTVANAALNATRIEAYSCLVGGLLSAGFCALFIYGTRFFYLKIKNESWDELTWIPIVFLSIAAIVTGGIAIWSVIDPWTWVAINHPELWIAKKAFKL